MLIYNYLAAIPTILHFTLGRPATGLHDNFDNSVMITDQPFLKMITCLSVIKHTKTD